MTVEPLKPADVVDAKESSMPDAVMDVWNTHIAKNFLNGKAHILQDAVIVDLMHALDVSRAQVFATGWLDIEDIFRAVGWRVDYDKPGYNEDYAASFTFTKK